MVEKVFSVLDRKATIVAFRSYLKEWKYWKLKAMQRFPRVASPNMDGQPNNGIPHDPDAKFVNHADANHRYHERINCCKNLMTIGEEEEILGDILLHRFIEGWSVTKTMDYINDTYKIYLDERSYRRKQEQALWEGALMCPDDSVRVRK